MTERGPGQVQDGATTLVILVGHGGVPTDYPREQVQRLMALHRQRQARGGPPGEEEQALDRALRNHPRTAETDPYKAGLECLGAALADKLTGPLAIAYNEFCAPSVPEAVAAGVASGAREVVLLSAMMTPGGSHSEVEIPELVEALRRAHPEVRFEYAWPFDVEAVAGLMSDQVARFCAGAVRG